ncbi:MAG: universal stress protein [Chloroflexi bacterium]|nr:MAG: universal stress protein [Chloroflexota bacterium]
MGCIVCATRGGEGSRAVQMEAIRLAKETKKPLVFLFVADPESLGEVESGLIPALREELYWMGKTLLHIALRRAELADLQADLVIREGKVSEEIIRFLNESKAEVLLLGASRTTTHHIFGDDAIERFAQSIEKETGVPVRVIHPKPLIDEPQND